jgi:UDP-GlcNAc:undecaprenyl-phosphate GlcNAc-1-phosphate transferase
MPLEARLLTSLAAAVAVVYWTTPIAIRVAHHFEFFDSPAAAAYKAHRTPTPYLGGAAVVGGFVAVLLLLTGDWDRTLPLVGGVAVLWIVGTLDDRRTVSPGLRVGAELLIAASLWGLGLGWDLGAGAVVDLLVTAFWIVGVVNAFNLFDNMDGAASSMAGVVAAGLAVFGAVQGDAWLAVASAALSGACLGFLPYNLRRSPARIFLGDGGSMPVGFAIAALVMIGLAGTAAAWQSLAMGLLFVGIPALDTCLVVVSRTRRGISILTGGRDHLTHRARKRLHDARAVAVTLGAAQAIVSVLAVVALQGGPTAMIAAVVLYVAGLGVAITLLDNRYAPETAAAAPPAEAAPAVAVRGPGRERGGDPPRRLALEMLAPALLLPVGLAAGLSPFASGYYSARTWVPAGIAVVVLTAGLAIARPLRPSRPATAVLAALAGLAVWSLLSLLWADSIPQAVVEANRLLVYAVTLGALVLLVRSDRAAEWLLAAVGLATLAVALIVVGRMIGGSGGDLFLRGRLDQPLGYINGQASMFLLGLWSCMAAVEQRRSTVLAGAGAAAAALLASMLLLSQSRGVGLAAAGSVVLVLALVPGRLRRLWALLAIAAGTAVAASAQLDVFTAANGTTPPDDVVRSAALAALAGAATAGILWFAAVSVAARTGSQAWVRNAAVAGAAALLLAGAGVAVVQSGRIADTLERQYDAFVNLSVEPQGSSAETGSRLVSGAGNRYDYWRVSWAAWKDRPLLGWGAGNFDGPYFERRATTEDIRQPHSLQLQTLVELGLVGALLLAALAAALAWGAWRWARAAAADRRARATTAAAAGMLLAWLLHTSLDWIHLLPGVTLAALAAIAILVRPLRAAGAPAAFAIPSRPRLASAAAVAAVLALTGVSLAREAMTDHFLSRGQDALAADPGRALVEADRVLRLDPESVPAYYVKSAALARFNEPEASRAALEEAARREPRDFVTWALLGDLARRAGDEELARRDYARARALNPRDPTLAAAAAGIP